MPPTPGGCPPARAAAARRDQKSLKARLLGLGPAQGALRGPQTRTHVVICKMRTVSHVSTGSRPPVEPSKGRCLSVCVFPRYIAIFCFKLLHRSITFCASFATFCFLSMMIDNTGSVRVLPALPCGPMSPHEPRQWEGRAARRPHLAPVEKGLSYSHVSSVMWGVSGGHETSLWLLGRPGSLKLAWAGSRHWHLGTKHVWASARPSPALSERGLSVIPGEAVVGSPAVMSRGRGRSVCGPLAVHHPLPDSSPTPDL